MTTRGCRAKGGRGNQGQRETVGERERGRGRGIPPAVKPRLEEGATPSGGRESIGARIGGEARGSPTVRKVEGKRGEGAREGLEKQARRTSPGVSPSHSQTGLFRPLFWTDQIATSYNAALSLSEGR